MIRVVPELAGTPSDDLPYVLATGHSDVTFFSVNMSARHPQGRTPTSSGGTRSTTDRSMQRRPACAVRCAWC